MNQDFSPQLLPDPDQGWWPLAFSRQLGRRPLDVVFAGQPLVLFRPGPGQLAVLPDICPHRHAPLSQGRVTSAGLKCPYHGWCFNARGQCTRIPGSQACSKGSLLQPWLCQEREGVIWVSRLGGMAIPGLECEIGDSFWIGARARTDLLNGAENFLEAYHTHFVHVGWIRRDARRQKVEASLKRLEDGLEVEYRGESGQDGWISRLLEPKRSRSFGRFLWPNLAQIEYRDSRDRLSFLASAWLTPVTESEMQVFIRITTRRGWTPAWLKQRLLRCLFHPILQQDLRILAQVSHNRSRFHPPPPPLDVDHDLMGPALRQLLETRQLSNIQEKHRTLWV